MTFVCVLRNTLVNSGSQCQSFRNNFLALLLETFDQLILNFSQCYNNNIIFLLLIINSLITFATETVMNSATNSGPLEEKLIIFIRDFPLTVNVSRKYLI